MGRIRLAGKQNGDGKLVSVTFSNKSGGSFSLPVRDETEPGNRDEQPDPKRPRLSFVDWAAKHEDAI